MHREIKRERESVCVCVYRDTKFVCAECVRVERGERECVCVQRKR